jgi:hypothetical protein
MGLNGNNQDSMASATFFAHKRPLARSEDLVVESLADELLVYDLETKTAHCLSPLAARVWRVCDGETSPEKLARALEVDRGEIDAALDQLHASGLLVTPQLGGSTRREFGMKVSKVAAGAAALPLVLSMAAPAAAQTQSVILFCFNLSGPDGVQECATCNEQTGNNTNCCCCHQAERTALLVPSDNSKDCAPKGTYCVSQMGGTHCTEAVNNDKEP